MAYLLRSQWRQPNTVGALIEKTVNQAQSQRILVSDERIRPESSEEKKKKNLTLQRKETIIEPSQHWWNASALSTLLALLVVSKIITIIIYKITKIVHAL